MLIVPVKDSDSLERAIKKLKKKFDRTGVIKELRERQQFTKKSVLRRKELLKAAYVQEKFGDK